MVRNIIPLILAGGAGTRLWPLSRGQAPKQFLKLDGKHTLLQHTLLRCAGKAFDTRPILVGAADHRGQLLETMQTLQRNADIILEPMRRNSCAAIAAGVLRALERDKNALVMVLAADHHIPDVAAFEAAVHEAAKAAADGKIVTFGIKPHHAAIGYGYILPRHADNETVARKIERFVEKPDAETAERYLAEGYLWNSGNFLFRAERFVEELAAHAPDILKAVSQALQMAERDRDFIRLATDPFSASPTISVDYAVMEKTAEAVVLPVDYFWTDIGTWDSVATMITLDATGNAIVGRGIVQGGKNVMIHSEGRLTTVIGCDDLVVITTGDAVLVARKGATEDVKSLVDRLRAKGYVEADGAVEPSSKTIS
jgi:mannose-1-phosphate guanylyltransferase / mannose-6-phosphate isomerase